MNLETVKVSLHNRILELRAINYLINFNEEFISILEAAKKEDQDYIILIIERGNKQELFEWFKKQMRTELDEKPVKELRQIASQLGVTCPNLYTKNELLELIRDRRRTLKIGSFEAAVK